VLKEEPETDGPQHDDEDRPANKDPYDPPDGRYADLGLLAKIAHGLGPVDDEIFVFMFFAQVFFPFFHKFDPLKTSIRAFPNGQSASFLEHRLRKTEQCHGGV
jgi:hypothetical protein